MSKKYSELPSTQTVGDNDLIAIAQGGTSKKIIASDFIKVITSGASHNPLVYSGADTNQTISPYNFTSTSDDFIKISHNRLEQYLDIDYTITMPNIVNWITKTIVDGDLLNYKKF